jgi:hypothetical protein
MLSKLIGPTAEEDRTWTQQRPVDKSDTLTGLEETW